MIYAGNMLILWSQTFIMIHRRFRWEVINILNITRYAIKNECLIPWVKFFWHIEAANADIHYKLLPTDCIDVILNLADDVVYETTWGKFKKFLTNDVVRGIQIIDHDWALDLMDRSRQ